MIKTPGVFQNFCFFNKYHVNHLDQSLVFSCISCREPSNIDMYIWMFPKIGGKTPKRMVKIMENPIKMDDLGVPLFLETPTYIYIILYI